MNAGPPPGVSSTRAAPGMSRERRPDQPVAIGLELPQRGVAVREGRVPVAVVAGDGHAVGLVGLGAPLVDGDRAQERPVARVQHVDFVR